MTESRGKLFVFRRPTGEFVVARLSNMQDSTGRRDTEYISLGEGETIPEALRKAANAIPDDVEGVRWSDDW